MNVTSLGGYQYLGALVWKVPLEPAITQNLYPFDAYFVAFNVTLAVDGLTPNKTSIGFYLWSPPSQLFNNQTYWSGVSTNGFLTRVSIALILDRKPTLIVPIMQPIYAIYVLLGLTAWLPYRRKYLDARITFLSGLFTFVVVLFFTVNQVLQQQVGSIIGLPLPLLMLMGLVWCTVIFLATSLISARMFERTKTCNALIATHLLNFGLSFVALVVISWFSQPELITNGLSAAFSLDLGKIISTSVLWNLGQVGDVILVGLFGPAILLIGYDLFRERSSIIMEVERLCERYSRS
jgi:hypothetical protein